MTVSNTLSTLVHHGINFVPLGYAHANKDITNVEEVHGGRCSSILYLVQSDIEFAGSPWGAGTITGPTGARSPSELELRVAKTQGSAFYQLLSKHKFD